MTAIEWTEKTWNPITGCSIVSSGCTNCYAMKMAHRLSKIAATPQYHNTVEKTRGGPVWTGKIGIASDQVFTQPLRQKRPTMYFVNSMSDLFHESVPLEIIDRIFAVMALCPQHTFQILTKRADRMREYFTMDNNRGRWLEIDQQAQTLSNTQKNRPLPTYSHKCLPNVWLGVSVENQQCADERIPHLLATPAAVRLISAEPLLGPLELYSYLNKIQYGIDLCKEAGGGSTSGTLPALDWVICGGESGPKSRPMHPDWARSLRNQCMHSGVPFFFKQWGNWITDIDRDINDPDWRMNYSKADKKGYRILNLEGGHGFHGQRVHLMKRTTKKTAGRHLDGRLWGELPEVSL